MDEEETLRVFGKKLGILERQFDILNERSKVGLNREQTAKLCELFSEEQKLFESSDNG